MQSDHVLFVIEPAFTQEQELGYGVVLQWNIGIYSSVHGPVFCVIFFIPVAELNGDRFCILIPGPQLQAAQLRFYIGELLCFDRYKATGNFTCHSVYLGLGSGHIYFPNTPRIHPVYTDVPFVGQSIYFETQAKTIASVFQVSFPDVKCAFISLLVLVRIG